MAILIAFAFLVIQDQNRLQPWVYIYLLFLLPFSFRKQAGQNPSFFLIYFRLILIGVYFWSGIQKVNGQFNEVVFTSILQSLFGLDDPEQIAGLLPLGYAIPVIEAGAALLLIFAKTRKFAVYLLLAMHVFILCYISPLGINSNSTVYPWNVAMMVFLVLLFFDIDPLSAWSRPQLKNPRMGIVLLVVWLLPILNLFGYWDHYLSFSLFSGKTSKYYLIINKSETANLDDRYHSYFADIKNLKDKKLIDFSAWSFKELNVPLYPESRVFRKIARKFCDMGLDEKKFYFLEIDQNDQSGNYIELHCSDLKN